MFQNKQVLKISQRVEIWENKNFWNSTKFWRFEAFFSSCLNFEGSQFQEKCNFWNLLKLEEEFWLWNLYVWCCKMPFNDLNWFETRIFKINQWSIIINSKRILAPYVKIVVRVIYVQEMFKKYAART